MVIAKEGLEKQIKELLLDRGAAMVGFASMKDITSLPGGSMEWGISIAVSLDPEIIKNINEYPTKEYFQEYKRVNAMLDRLGRETAGLLRKNGYRALSLEPTGDITLYEDLCSPLPHKTVATRAGLGWIGKTALLVTKQFGSALRFTSVLTDMEFSRTGIPVSSSRCGDCRICVDDCPGNAATGRDWDTGMERAEFFDAQICHVTARERSEAAGITSTICGRCIAVCPWTEKYLKMSLKNNI